MTAVRRGVKLDSIGIPGVGNCFRRQ